MRSLATRHGHCEGQLVQPSAPSLVGLPAIIRPAKQPGSANLRFRGWRSLPDLGLRRWCGWRRQIVAFHRIDQFALCSLADGRAGIGACGCALDLGRQLSLRPSRGRHQRDEYQPFLHRSDSRHTLSRPDRTGCGKSSIAGLDSTAEYLAELAF